MATRPRPGFDLPPTAGLPLSLRDLLPGGNARLADGLAAYLGLPAVQVTCSGTAALVIVLTALRRLAPARTTVIVPAYTCPLVALAAAHCGLPVRVCDLLPDSLDMDPDALSALCGPDTLAIVPTHLAGRITDVLTACRLARGVGAWVIEDAAQALGARVDGRSVGLQGDVGFFSLAVGKGLTMSEGGVLVSTDPLLRELFDTMSDAVTPPRAGWELRRSVELLGYAALYRPAGLRMAYGRPLRRDLARGDWIAAAGDDFDVSIPLHRPGPWRQSVALRALRRLPAFLAQAERHAASWMTALATIPGLTPIRDTRGAGVWPVVLVLLPDRAARDAALSELWGSGYGVSLPFVHVLPDYGYLRDTMVAAREDGLPEARRFADRVLAIGNSPWVTDADRVHVCAVLRGHATPGSVSAGRSGAAVQIAREQRI
jgi:dTDP-4-amino-4,6-dideoxygalactose transaminase